MGRIFIVLAAVYRVLIIAQNAHELWTAHDKHKSDKRSPVRRYKFKDRTNAIHPRVPRTSRYKPHRRS